MKRFSAIVLLLSLAIWINACCPSACRGSCTCTGTRNRIHIVTYECGPGNVRQVSATANGNGNILITCCTRIIACSPI